MFFDVVQSLCKSHGISITNLTKQLKISQSNVTNWRNGSVPKADKVSKIASYFGVSVDYLLGNEQKNKPSAEAEGFSKNKKELMDLFDSMNDAQQESFLAIARATAHELSSRDTSK